VGVRIRVVDRSRDVEWGRHRAAEGPASRGGR
jgi:hypothetical protein